MWISLRCKVNGGEAMPPLQMRCAASSSSSSSSSTASSSTTTTIITTTLLFSVSALPRPYGDWQTPRAQSHIQWGGGITRRSEPVPDLRWQTSAGTGLFMWFVPAPVFILAAPSTAWAGGRRRQPACRLLYCSPRKMMEVKVTFFICGRWLYQLYLNWRVSLWGQVFGKWCQTGGSDVK